MFKRWLLGLARFRGEIVKTIGLTNREAKAVIIENTKIKYGSTFDLKACQRALAKEARSLEAWQPNVWCECLASYGLDHTASFYESSLKKVLPKEGTVNKETYRDYLSKKVWGLK